MRERIAAERAAILAVVDSDPDVVGGTPVFVGTQVPFQTLIDYLAAGRPPSEFLGDFPTVTKEQALAALEQARDALLARVRISYRTSPAAMEEEGARGGPGENYRARLEDRVRFEVALRLRPFGRGRSPATSM